MNARPIDRRNIHMRKPRIVVELDLEDAEYLYYCQNLNDGFAKDWWDSVVMPLLEAKDIIEEAQR